MNPGVRLPGLVRHRPTVAQIDLDAVRHNVRSLMPARAELMAVVKANGYGHGAVRVAAEALEAGATWLGVALVEEGVQLRDAGIEAPILVLTEFPPGSEADALAADLSPTLYTDEGLARLAAAADPAGPRPAVHVKVDTGMHRVGLPHERAAEFSARVVEAGFMLGGLWTHFAKAEETNDPFTALQLERFRAVAESLAARDMRPRLLHAANTAAAMAVPEAHLDLVRVGIGIYGLPPDPTMDGRVDLKPALTWRSAVAMTKRVAAGEGLSYGLRYRMERASTIATVPVGYADGYPRGLSNLGRVLIGGHRRPVAGTITMDQLLVDCGDDPVGPGDPVVLIGRQDEERITAWELAERIGTIGYEVVCGVSERVPREYLGSSASAP